MTITKTEILTAIDEDITDIDNKIDNYTRTLCLLNSTKTWVENNL
jgi:hypothetical protein